MSIFEIIMIAFGLSMDASTASMTNGLSMPHLKKKKIILMSFLFGFFQGLMPLIGFLIGHLFYSYITFITPYIAILLLGFLGMKMIFDAFDEDENRMTKSKMLIQAIATSIDALAIGIIFTQYGINIAIVATTLIFAVTFVFCFTSFYIGKRFGSLLKNKAQLLGGIILIIIGIKIFVDGVFLK